MIPRAEAEQIKAHTVTRHPHFATNLVERHTLSQNMRAAKDLPYSQFLLDVGDGALPAEPAVGPSAVRLPETILAPADTDVEALATWIFGDVRAEGLRCASGFASTEDINSLSAKALLTPKNDVVNSVNAMILQTFDQSEVQDLFSSDSIGGGSAEDYGNYPVDFLNSLEMPGLPPHQLRLTPGAVIMLIRNLDCSSGLCNGVRAVVVKCETKVLEVLIITGKARGQRYFLPRIPMTSQANSLPFLLQRRQFPVKLAWAMTINKAQGQSLERVGIYLEDPVFAHGQLYVALSRAGSFGKVRVLVRDTDAQGRRQGEAAIPDGTYTDNIVYRDILLGPREAATAADAQRSLDLILQCGEDDDPEADAEVRDCARETDDDQLQQALQVDLASDNAAAMLEASSHPAAPVGNDSHDSVYTGYFERQVRGRCGLHALNNALGFDLLDPCDMSHACDVFLAEMAMEGSPELRHNHENKRGWYSEAVMAQALRVKNNLYMLDLDNPLRPNQDSMMRIFAEDVRGIVVNLDQRHWVAFRILDGNIWFLNSQGAPELKSFEQLCNYITEFRHAFLLRAV